MPMGYLQTIYELCFEACFA